jgi:hypothetical protein
MSLLFNTDELRSIEQTTNKLVDVAMSLSDKNSRDRINAVTLSTLVSELRMVAFIAETSPEAAATRLLEMIAGLRNNVTITDNEVLVNSDGKIIA